VTEFYIVDDYNSDEEVVEAMHKLDGWEATVRIQSERKHALFIRVDGLLQHLGGSQFAVNARSQIVTFDVTRHRAPTPPSIEKLLKDSDRKHVTIEITI